MITVGVIRGGTNTHYDTSLETGGHLLSELRNERFKDTYKVVDIFIDKEGLWHMGGIPVTMPRLASSVDVILNALHGGFGENGALQEILDRWDIPYVGSDSQSSAISYNKESTKQEFDHLGIKTPRHILFPAYQEDFDGPIEEYAQAKAKHVWERFSPPWIMKPLTKGSSMGVHVCKTYAELVRAFEMGVSQNVSVIFEEMIEGKKASVVVVEKFRGQDLYSFPVIEIGETRMTCPGNFSSDEKKELERLALQVHKELGFGHYSQTDFVVHPRRGMYGLETTTLPRITTDTPLFHALSSVGANTPEFLDHVITLAYQKKNL